MIKKSDQKVETKNFEIIKVLDTDYEEDSLVYDSTIRNLVKNGISYQEEIYTQIRNTITGKSKIQEKVKERKVSLFRLDIIKASFLYEVPLKGYKPITPGWRIETRVGIYHVKDNLCFPPELIEKTFVNIGAYVFKVENPYLKQKR